MLATILPLAGCAGYRGTLTSWVVDDCTEVFADAQPQLETRLYSAAQQVINLDAALNETVAFQLVLRPDTPPFGPLQLELTDLVGDGGATIPASAVTVYQMRPVLIERYRSWYPDHAIGPATPRYVHDLLVPWPPAPLGQPLTLTRAENTALWVDVAVPPTIAPGRYRGSIRLRGAGGQTAFASAVNLRVVPLALPAAPALPILCRVDPTDLLHEHLRWPRRAPEETLILASEPTHAEALALLDETMRLFQRHRLSPILWASFPKYRLVDAAHLELDWADYDALVERWIDGASYADRTPAPLWPLPASTDYPSAARNGGLRSPQYARLFGRYLKDCAAHFEQRGWLDRAVVRPIAPTELSAAHVRAVNWISEIRRLNDVATRLVAHLPPRSLGGLGWRGAPAIDAPGVEIWAPPAQWAEPEALSQQHSLGHAAWLAPSFPPYSGSLASAANATDQRALGWLAFRYQYDAIWIERAAEFADPTNTDCLLYPGRLYGAPDRPLPSVRMKRLRRAAQDVALLELLTRHGGGALAERLAEQIVPYALTGACREHLLSCLPASWPADAEWYVLARRQVMHELLAQLAPAYGDSEDQRASLARWRLLLSQAEGLRATVSGVRLAKSADALTARVHVALRNTTSRKVTGAWSAPQPPPGWEFVGPVAVDLPARARRQSTLTAEVAGLTYNADGVNSFDLAFDSPEVGQVVRQARLAVATATTSPHKIRIDGDLSDWPLGVNNAAGDFRLCRGRRGDVCAEPTPSAPVNVTRAYFARDDDNLYIAVRCQLAGGEKASWTTDSEVPVDGIVPWGQDVVEVVLSPDNADVGGPGDLRLVQIKPSGLTRTWLGCPTNPPVGRSEPWNASARVSVRHGAGEWIVELALPLRSLGDDALRQRVWGVNVTRLDARRGEYSSWSGARGHCYSPATLGNLILAD